MTIQETNRGVLCSREITLIVICFFLLGCLGYVGLHYVRLGVVVAFASDQTAIFEDLRHQALKSSSRGSVSELIDGVKAYYPTGTKQRTGSVVDQIVERHRAAVLREMQTHLDKLENH